MVRICVPKKPVIRKNVSSDIAIFSLCCLWVVWWTSNVHLLFVFQGPFVVIRMLWFIRELFTIDEYHNKTKLIKQVFSLLKRCIKMKNWISFVTSCFVFGLGYYCSYKEQNKSLYSEYCYSLQDIIGCLGYTVMGLYFQWTECPLIESYRLEESLTLSGGSVMAFGYFYGYLKLILSDLPEKIRNFQSRQNIDDKKIPEKKLFILVPSSTFIFDKLRMTSEDDHTTIEPLEGQKLEPHRQDRGLVLNREYKNTMYKIKRKKLTEQDVPVTKYYVPLEGASPLKTFRESCKDNQEYEEFRSEVICSFYYTLKALLDRDNEVRGLAEIIYYDDEKNPDIEICHVVEERIEYLKQLKEDKKKKA